MKYTIYFIFFLLLGCNNDVNVKAVTKVKLEKTISNDSLEVYDFNAIEKFLNIKDEKIYVVNFWATWCAPCVKELPHFEKIGQDYKSENVEVILISLDFPKHYQTKLKPFLKKNNIQSKVIVLNDVDSNTWIPKVHENWSGAIPATLIYNKNKQIFYEQSFSYNELETQLKQFLNN